MRRTTAEWRGQEMWVRNLHPLFHSMGTSFHPWAWEMLNNAHGHDSGEIFRYFKSSLTPIHNLPGLPSDEPHHSLTELPPELGLCCMCYIQTAYVYMHIHVYLHTHMGCWSKERCSARVKLGSINPRLQLSCTVRSLLSLHWDKLRLLSFLYCECLL